MTGPDIRDEWIGRLVRVLVVFRTLVLFVTIVNQPAADKRPAVTVAVTVALVFSYIQLRHWNRIARSVARHPAYLGFEVLVATLILSAAGVGSAFFYYTLGTAALAGIVYGRQGAIPFLVLLIGMYQFVALEGLGSHRPLHDAQTIVFAPLLYIAALLTGIAAREMVARGVRTEALLRERTQSLAAERERLRVARELHDSLAKTVEGLAMAASVLPTRCERNPAGAAELARQLLADARQAAVEARALMSDLRPSADSEVSLGEAVRRRTESLAARSGIGVEVHDDLAGVGQSVPPTTTHELLRIVSEAVANAVHHGRAEKVVVSLTSVASDVLVSVADDGKGLSGDIDTEQLKAAGHFGIAGMSERARALGGDLRISEGPGEGAVVEVRVPAAPGLVSAANDQLPSRLRGLVLGRIRQPRSARVRV